MFKLFDFRDMHDNKDDQISDYDEILSSHSASRKYFIFRSERFIRKFRSVIRRVKFC